LAQVRALRLARKDTAEAERELIVFHETLAVLQESEKPKNLPLLTFLLFLSASVFLLAFIADREVTIRAEEGGTSQVPARLVIANPEIIFASSRSPYMRDER
jgi:hypothetical protein